MVMLMISFFKAVTFETPDFVEILNKIIKLFNDAGVICVLYKSEKSDYYWLPTTFMEILTIQLQLKRDSTQVSGIPLSLINMMATSEGLDKYHTDFEKFSLALNTTFKQHEFSIARNAFKEHEANFAKLEKIFEDIKNQVAIYLHGLLFLAFSFDATKDVIFGEREPKHFLSNEIYRQLTLQGLYKAPVLTDLTLTEHQKRSLALNELEGKLEELHATYCTQLTNSKTATPQRI
jgi:hypothetical protein